MADFHREKRAIRALLEAQPDSWAKREEFRNAMRRRVAKTLTLRNPKLDPKVARDMAVVVIQNMKTVGALSQDLRGDALSGALMELREMTRLYLEAKLGNYR